MFTFLDVLSALGQRARGDEKGDECNVEVVEYRVILRFHSTMP